MTTMLQVIGFHLESPCVARCYEGSQFTTLIGKELKRGYQNLALQLYTVYNPLAFAFLLNYSQILLLIQLFFSILLFIIFLFSPRAIIREQLCI